jgi:hypothetical protein
MSGERKKQSYSKADCYPFGDPKCRVVVPDGGFSPVDPKTRDSARSSPYVASGFLAEHKNSELERQSPTMTNRRLLALEFIRRYFCEFGGSPSYNEIAAHLGVQTQRVGRILAQLEAAGEILRTPGIPRSIRLPDRTDELSTAEIRLILQRRGFAVMSAEHDPLSEKCDGNGTAAPSPSVR